MLRFEYVHKEDIGIFAIELINTQLYVTSYDETTLTMINNNPSFRPGVCLNQIFDNTTYRLLKQACKKLGSTYSATRFNYSLPLDGMLRTFSVTLCRLDYLEKTYFVASVIEPTSQHSILKHDLDNELQSAYYSASFDGIFTLQLTILDHLLLVNYNTVFNDYFHVEDSIRYQDIINIYPPSLVNFLTENAKSALSAGNPITAPYSYHCTAEEQAKYLTPSNGCFYISVTFLPLPQPEYRCVLCCARDRTKEVIARKETQDLLNEYTCLFNLTKNATAVICTPENLQPFIERINAPMDQLMTDLPSLTLQTLLTNPIWEKTLASKEPTADTFTLVRAQKKYHFQLSLIPVINDGKLSKIIVIIVDSTDIVNEQMSQEVKLTHREREVISYVISGQKNSYIADKLCISLGTVKRTLSNAYSKLNISSRVELINLYHSRGIDKICT